VVHRPGGMGGTPPDGSGRWPRWRARPDRPRLWPGLPADETLTVPYAGAPARYGRYPLARGVNEAAAWIDAARNGAGHRRFHWLGGHHRLALAAGGAAVLMSPGLPVWMSLMASIPA